MVAALTTGALLVATVVFARNATKLPPLQNDSPSDPVPERTPDLVAQIPLIAGHAIPEKERAAPAGVCDYPGPYAPCWCGTGPLQGIPVNCDSAEDYLESVQEFGAPRRVIVGVRKDRVVDFDITTE